MTLVLLIEQSDGRVGWYKPSPEQYEVTEETEFDFLDRLEKEYNKEGVVTHGIIDETAIPQPPVGGSTSDLSWDGAQLAYGNAYAKLECRAERDARLRQWDLTTQVYLETSNTNLTSLLTYRQELRDLGTAIDADPYNVPWPIEPLEIPI